MELQKLDNFSWAGLEVVKIEVVFKERVAQGVRGWTVQNEMRNVLVGLPKALHEGFSILPILER